METLLLQNREHDISQLSRHERREFSFNEMQGHLALSYSPVNREQIRCLILDYRRPQIDISYLTMLAMTLEPRDRKRERVACATREFKL